MITGCRGECGELTMDRFNQINASVPSTAFKERGRNDVIKIDVFPIRDGELLQLTFEKVNSSWRQGVCLSTDTYLLVNDQRCPSVEIWQDTAPKNVKIECHTQSGDLRLYNIWDSGRGLGMESQSWSSGMLIERLSNGRRYCCNDIGFDTNFDNLVFRLERVDLRST